MELIEYMTNMGKVWNAFVTGVLPWIFFLTIGTILAFLIADAWQRRGR